ncbi:DUF2461 family protein [Chitinophaga oryzae]|uniref:DUF2461 family protein n=1 Tax=Chitinophaga oryzae TaxID=2725414 RepID=A0AAE6ZHA3_9BACT|nr:DUF2461 family protein [Chitinophaga oryzae]QJB32167.1 DUF2461 family protein [Chitinophaga oryzae]QJB38643.1 DUF2461 family protein [Chitinophaga oryzae]
MNISVLNFLTALAANNNREWFTAHKHLYNSAREEMPTKSCWQKTLRNNLLLFTKR